MSCNPSTFVFLLPYCLFRVATQAARGAQYSPQFGHVNASSHFFFGPESGCFKPGTVGLGFQLELDPGKAVRAHLKNVIRTRVEGQTTVRNPRSVDFDRLLIDLAVCL